MNILYINGHPYEKSFHAAIQETYVSAASKKHSVKVLELGKEDFDPILRFGYAKHMKEDPFIKKSQELVLWADHIVFAFPIWWGDAPALLRGWIDRVFTPGVTYGFTGTKINALLKGRTADLFITSRGLRPIYWLIGDLAIPMFTRNLFLLTGLKRKRILSLGGIGLVPQTNTLKRREKFLQKVAARGATMHR